MTMSTLSMRTAKPGMAIVLLLVLPGSNSFVVLPTTTTTSMLTRRSLPPARSSSRSLLQAVLLPDPVTLEVAGASAAAAANLVYSATAASEGAAGAAAGGILAGLDTFFRTEPYVAAFLTCCVKASAADALSQSTTQQKGDQKQPHENVQQQAATLIKEDSKQLPLIQQQQQEQKHFDVMRNLAFVSYGGLYQGMGQQYLYTHVYPEIFQFDEPWKVVVAQVATEMTLLGPCFCLPLCYTLKALFSSSSKHDGNTFQGDNLVASLSATVQAGLEHYRSDVINKGLLFKYWSLWIPVQSFTFTFVPSHYRVFFVAMVSFFWVFLLSTLSSSSSSSSAATESTTEEQVATATLQHQEHFQKSLASALTFYNEDTNAISEDAFSQYERPSSSNSKYHAVASVK